MIVSQNIENHNFNFFSISSISANVCIVLFSSLISAMWNLEIQFTWDYKMDIHLSLSFSTVLFTLLLLVNRRRCCSRNTLWLVLDANDKVWQDGVGYIRASLLTLCPRLHFISLITPSFHLLKTQRTHWSHYKGEIYLNISHRQSFFANYFPFFIEVQQFKEVYHFPFNITLELTLTGSENDNLKTRIKVPFLIWSTGFKGKSNFVRICI